MFGWDMCWMIDNVSDVLYHKKKRERKVAHDDNSALTGKLSSAGPEQTFFRDPRLTNATPSQLSKNEESSCLFPTQSLMTTRTVSRKERKNSPSTLLLL